MKNPDLKRRRFRSVLERGRHSTGQGREEVSELRLPLGLALAPLLREVREGLEAGHEVRLERKSQVLVDAICAGLRVQPPRVVVLSARPLTVEGELHGLYLRNQYGARPRIKVWMRTATRRQPVAIRTFIRTLLHELCHHLDVELLKLDKTAHTPSFFRREATLVRWVLGELGRGLGH